MAWPVTLTEDGITLRPLRLRDARAWREVRLANREWLKPWDATLPPEAVGAAGEVPVSFGQMVRRQKREAIAGRMLPWAIVTDRLVGQVTVGGIAYGSVRSAYIGYWIDHRVAGRGITPRAVAMATDYCFDVLRLHRIELNIRPENAASLRVAEKLGLREEGFRPAYLHIDGQWCDHRVFAVVAEEFPGGLRARLRSRAAQ